MSGRVGLMVSDLAMRSKVSTMVKARGFTPVYIRSVASLAEATTAESLCGLIVDLNAQSAALPELTPIVRSGRGGKTLGYFSHVTASVGDAGREVGLEQVIPRSKIESVIPSFLEDIEKLSAAS